MLRSIVNTRPGLALDVIEDEYIFEIEVGRLPLHIEFRNGVHQCRSHPPTSGS